LKKLNKDCPPSNLDILKNNEAEINYFSHNFNNTDKTYSNKIIQNNYTNNLKEGNKDLNNKNKPIIKGRGNFMWTSQNEIFNQTENELWDKLNKLTINDYDNDDEINEEQEIEKEISKRNKYNNNNYYYNYKTHSYSNNCHSKKKNKNKNEAISKFNCDVKSLSYEKMKDNKDKTDNIIQIEFNEDYIGDDGLEKVKKCLNDLYSLNLDIKKSYNNTFIIHCESSCHKEEIINKLNSKAHHFKITKYQNQLKDNKKLKIEKNLKFPSININAFQRMIQSHLNSNK